MSKGVATRNISCIELGSDSAKRSNYECGIIFVFNTVKKIWTFRPVLEILKLRFFCILCIFSIVVSLNISAVFTDEFSLYFIMFIILAFI